MKTPQTKTPDVRTHNSGSIITFAPMTEAAREWFFSNVQAEPWQWFGGQLCVEPRYASDLIDGLKGDGLEVA